MIPGKFEENIHEICSKIPQNSLALCFVDPFNCDFNFEDIRKISKSARVDFICLLALQMDAKRNEQHYLQPDSKIDRMIGNPTWRVRWKNRVNHNEDFAKFLANEFANSMTEIGYKKTQLHEMKTVKMQIKKYRCIILHCLQNMKLHLTFGKKL
jgi:three-Cys-motif partner protein